MVNGSACLLISYMDTWVFLVVLIIECRVVIDVIYDVCSLILIEPRTSNVRIQLRKQATLRPIYLSVKLGDLLNEGPKVVDLFLSN